MTEDHVERIRTGNREMGYEEVGSCENVVVSWKEVVVVEEGGRGVGSWKKRVVLAVLLIKKHDLQAPAHRCNGRCTRTEPST